MVNLVKSLVFVLFSILLRVRLVGRDKIPEDGPALLCANHISELDMFFIGYRIRRLVHWMAKEELFRNRFLAWLLPRLGTFPVRRGTGDIGAIKTALRLLKEGHIVGIFPEGHRRRKKGVMKVHAGTGMLAVKSGVPILPVAIEGSGRIFSRVRVVFGDPFTIEAEKGKKYSNEELMDISNQIMDRIQSLLEV